MRFIVTGSPRSATRYAARLLQALRVPCTHEHALRPFAQVIDVVRWWRDAGSGESSWMAWTLLPMLPGPIPVIHIVRNPWAVIDSLANRNSICKPEQLGTKVMQSIRDTITAYLPEAFAWEARIDRAASLVLGWNRLIAERVPKRCVIHVERLDAVAVRGMLHHIGIERSGEEIQSALSSVRTNVNAGYTVVDTPGISDPQVAEWIKQYAEERGCSRVYTRKIKNAPNRQTPEELAAGINPELLTQVNEYAERHGYATVELAEAVL